MKKLKKNALFRVVVRKLGSAFLDIGTALRHWALSPPPPPRPLQTVKNKDERLALVAGYFSFKDGFATFGDTEAMRVVLEWLDWIGIRYDVACDPSNGLIGVDIGSVDPASYDLFVFVCGPWKMDNNDLIRKFSHCLKVGVNLSIEDMRSNEFDLLYPRDTSDVCNPDIVFSSDVSKTPLIGVCLVHAQYEYGDKQRHTDVVAAVEEYLSHSQMASVKIDTLYVDNKAGVHDTLSFENLVSKFDVVISSRLHGMVFSLKNGTPVVAIDSISGGAKVTKQARALGWPVVINGDVVSAEAIGEAIALCLTPEMQNKAGQIRDMAIVKINVLKEEFVSDVQINLINRHS